MQRSLIHVFNQLGNLVILTRRSFLKNYLKDCCPPHTIHGPCVPCPCVELMLFRYISIHSQASDLLATNRLPYLPPLPLSTLSINKMLARTLLTFAIASLAAHL